MLKKGLNQEASRDLGERKKRWRVKEKEALTRNLGMRKAEREGVKKEEA